ncbi:hypothetical protein CHS0354_018583, partial [Potamilus streckersoni]
MPLEGKPKNISRTYGAKSQTSNPIRDQSLVIRKPGEKSTSDMNKAEKYQKQINDLRKLAESQKHLKDLVKDVRGKQREEEDKNAR